MGCKDLCDVPMVVEAAAAIRPARGSAPADTGTSVRKQILDTAGKAQATEEK